MSPGDGGVRRHLDHQPRGYSDPHRSAGERRFGASVARRQAGEALYSVALRLTYQFDVVWTIWGLWSFFSCGNMKLYINSAFNLGLLTLFLFHSLSFVSFYQFPPIFLLLHLFQLVCPHLCWDVSIAALFHSPPLQSNSRSSIFALFFLCYFQTTPYPFFISTFSSLSSLQGTFSPAIMAFLFMCIITVSFWFDFWLHHQLPSWCNSYNFQLFHKSGDIFFSPWLFSNMDFMLCSDAQSNSGWLQECKCSAWAKK